MVRAGSRLVILGALFWCTIGLHASPLALAQPLRDHPAEDRPAIVRVDGFDFPRRIAGMRRVRVVNYGPGLGKGIRYENTDVATWADIYVYDRQKDLTRGSRTRHVRDEMRQALQELQFMIRLKHYRNLKITGRSSSNLFESMRFEIETAKRATASFLFLGVHRGKFVKIRLSAPPGPKASAIATSFVEDLSAALGLRRNMPETEGRTL